MEQFASGWKRNYYGKGDVIVYRLRRRGEPSVFGANIKMLVYGDAFWPTYTTGDNTGLIATDSMKNFIQREALSYEGPDLEGCCQFLGAKFLETYPQVEGVQVSAIEIPYSALTEERIAFAPSGPERAMARIELGRKGTIEAASGSRGAAPSRALSATSTPRFPTFWTGRSTCGWTLIGFTTSPRMR
ncbi:MAG: hypothetical protein DMG11_09625 [Acidobacteria bacterium]|nr:MAG: hypothetical protein DMG11_09625 [Acidobacteriota bacterium]